MKKRQRQLQHGKKPTQQVTIASPYEQRFRLLPPANRFAMPFKTSPYSAPVPIQICPCNNCQERAPPSCGNFVQEAPPQPTFLHNPAAVPSVPLLQPSAESTSGQVHYNVVQAKPLMTFVFGNGAQYAPAVIPILPYAPQIPFQDASSYNFQQGNGIHWIPSYQQQQFCYQPFTGQYMFHQPQPQNVPYMHHEDKESPVYYYYDPQDSVETQQNEEENVNEQQNSEALSESIGFQRNDNNNIS